MLNYGPIIVTLSTSKYSLVEIRGVFYKSAYSEDFFYQIPYVYVNYMAHNSTYANSISVGIGFLLFDSL